MSTNQNRVPKVGDDVWYFPPAEDLVARSNGNKGVVAAKITRPWGNTIHSACNLKIFPDHGAVQDRGSVGSMYSIKGTRTWCFPGDFPLDEYGVPMFPVDGNNTPRMDTING